MALSIGDSVDLELSKVQPVRKNSSISVPTSPLGIFYMALSSTSFACMSFFSKLMYTHSNISPFEAVYLRGFSMFIFNMVYAAILKVNVFAVPRPIEPMMWIRTLIGTVGISLNFISYRLLPISIANSLFYLYPLITSCGGYLFLKEKMSKLEVVGMFTSFAGVLCVITYSRNDTNSAEAIPIYYYIPSLTASFVAAGVYLVTRKMGHDVHFLVNPTWFGIVQSVIVTPIWLYTRSSEESWNREGDALLYTFAMCVGGWLGQVFMNMALQIEKAGRVAAIGYIQIPLLFLCDMFYFNLPIGWPVMVGSGLIILCNLTTGILRLLNLLE